jgi:hypothetical protein
VKAKQLKKGSTILVPAVPKARKAKIVELLKHRKTGHVAVRLADGERVIFDAEADVDVVQTTARKTARKR